MKTEVIAMASAKATTRSASLVLMKMKPKMMASASKHDLHGLHDHVHELFV
jgi:hypothetical protein